MFKPISPRERTVEIMLEMTRLQLNENRLLIMKTKNGQIIKQTLTIIRTYQSLSTGICTWFNAHLLQRKLNDLLEEVYETTANHHCNQLQIECKELQTSSTSDAIVRSATLLFNKKRARLATHRRFCRVTAVPVLKPK